MYRGSVSCETPLGNAGERDQPPRPPQSQGAEVAQDPREPGPPTTCICFSAGGGSVCLLVFGDHNSGRVGSQHVVTWRWGKSSNVRSSSLKGSGRWEERESAWPWGLR